MSSIEIGVCHGPDGVESPYAAAFSYREITLSVIEDIAQSGADVADFARQMVPQPRFVMGVFPLGTQLYGAPADLRDAWGRIDFVTQLAGRIDAAGLVFGAGLVRSIPPEVSRPDGERILAEVVGYLAHACWRHGTMLLVENLPSAKSNIFNTLDEIADFIDRYRIGNAFIVYDVKSAAAQGDDPQAAVRHRNKVRHVHVPGRELDGTGTALSVRAAVQRLVRAGYMGRISVEPDGEPLGPEAVAFAREMTRIVRAVDEPARI